jgi:hypothetical protein
MLVYTILLCSGAAVCWAFILQEPLKKLMTRSRRPGSVELDLLRRDDQSGPSDSADEGEQKDQK